MYCCVVMWCYDNELYTKQENRKEIKVIHIIKKRKRRQISVHIILY